LSSPDVRRTGWGLLAAALLALSVGGCGSATGGSTAAAATVAAAPADQVTHRIAEVEFARQCAVTTQSFPDESAITADLDTRLAAQNLTHAQWKKWHDELADSKPLLAQLAQVSGPGCPSA
jgi:hypothetical protein